MNITIRQKLATASVANAPPPPSSPAPPPKESPRHRHQECCHRNAMSRNGARKSTVRDGLAARRSVAVAVLDRLAVLYRHGTKSMMPCPNHLGKRHSRCSAGCQPPVVPPWQRGKKPEEGHRAKRSASAAPAARYRITGTTFKAGSACPPPPNRAREVPHLILEAHDVQPGDEFDKYWTLNEDR